VVEPLSHARPERIRPPAAPPELDGEFVEMLTAAHGLDSSRHTFNGVAGRATLALFEAATSLPLDRLGVHEDRRSAVRDEAKVASRLRRHTFLP